MSKTAIFASGCFWGTEYYLQKAAGVLSTTVGYTGGTVPNPTYAQVCTGKTGHVEAVQVEYDPALTNYETLARLFFETHDPTQRDGQGPDIGFQYLSKIFYADAEEQKIANELIEILREKGIDVVTKVEPVQEFYPAEAYHQDYYATTGGSPYCHIYRPLF